MLASRSRCESRARPKRFLDPDDSPCYPSEPFIPMSTSLSVLVPVYNERFLVAASLERLKALATSEDLERVEVIVVDDASTDETPSVLAQFERSLAHHPKMSWTFLRHERNGGKGQAIRTALERATCEITVIHDADLEYHPRDLLRMMRV